MPPKVEFGRSPQTSSHQLPHLQNRIENERLRSRHAAGLTRRPKSKRDSSKTNGAQFTRDYTSILEVTEAFETCNQYQVDAEIEQKTPTAVHDLCVGK